MAFVVGLGRRSRGFDQILPALALSPGGGLGFGGQGFAIA
jgi:hypothetical protein